MSRFPRNAGDTNKRWLSIYFTIFRALNMFKLLFENQNDKKLENHVSNLTATYVYVGKNAS